MEPQIGNNSQQTNDYSFNSQQTIGFQPEQPVTERRFNKKLLTILLTIFICVALLVFGAIEYLKVVKFSNSVTKIKTGSSYQSYIDDIGIFVDPKNSLYYDFRTCNIDSTDRLWDFEKPKDNKYSYPDFSMIYTATENDLRAKHEEVKKIIPKEYKKGIISNFMPGLSGSIDKRQKIIKLQEAVDKVFQANDYMSYCRNDIYTNLIDKLRFIKANADGSNTVVAGTDSNSMKKNVDEMLKMLTASSAPQDFGATKLEFAGVLSAISATYTKVSSQQSSTSVASSNRKEFSTYKDRLDKDLKNLASLGQKHNDLQKNDLTQALESSK